MHLLLFPSILAPCLTHVASHASAVLEKNKDPISQDLRVLVQFSDDEFIGRLAKVAVDIAAQDAADTAAGEAASAASGGPRKGMKAMRSGKFVGVVDGFKTSLKSLISTLQEGDLHFIRCLKPNDDKAAFTWDRAVSARQLASAGLVHAVSAARSGYSDHLPPMHLVSAFGALCPDVTTTDGSGAPLGDNKTARAVLEAIGHDAQVNINVNGEAQREDFPSRGSRRFARRAAHDARSRSLTSQCIRCSVLHSPRSPHRACVLQVAARPALQLLRLSGRRRRRRSCPRCSPPHLQRRDHHP